MRGFTARNTPYMGLVDRRPVVCHNLAMGFWVPLHYLLKWRRWEQSVGRALSEEAPIVEVG